MSLGGTPVLHISGTVPEMRFEDTTAANQDWSLLANGGDIAFYPETTGTATLTMQQSGKIGIGTATPGAPLTVSTSAGGDVLILNKTVAGQSTINFRTTHSADSNWRVGAAILVDSAFEIYNVNAAADRLLIDTSGNVGINTTSPTVALGVQGKGLATGGFATGGPDIAEVINVSDYSIEAGDVLVADEKDVTARKSSKPFDEKVLGIVSTDPGFTMFPKDTMSQNRTVMKNERLLALAGRVPVKATSENGNIMPGDSLTTSSKEGYAMKFALLDERKAKSFDELKEVIHENSERRNSIVGKALEACDKKECRILALVTVK